MMLLKAMVLVRLLAVLEPLVHLPLLLLTLEVKAEAVAVVVAFRLLVLPDHLDPMDNQDKMDPLAHLERTDHPEQLHPLKNNNTVDVKSVQRLKPVHQESLVQKDCPERPVLPERLLMEA